MTETEQTKSEPATTTPVVTPASLADSAPVAFFNKLVKLFTETEIQDWCRVIPKGFFVHEDGLSPLLLAYGKWLDEVAGSSRERGEEKLKRKLFHSDEPTLHYLLDGKRCLPGYLVLANANDLIPSKLPKLPAQVLDANISVHPRDPLLGKIPGFSPRMSQHEGLIIDLTVNGKVFQLTLDVVKTFAQFAKTSRAIRGQFPEVAGPLRNSLAPFCQCFLKAKPVPANQSLLIPSRLREKRDWSLFRFHGVYFVVQNGQRIIDCFDLGGRNRLNLIRKEIETFATPNNVNGFENSSNRKGAVGRIWSHRISFHLPLRTILHFLNHIPRSKKLRQKLPNQFTVVDVLRKLVSLFRSSNPIDDVKAAQLLRGRRRAYCKYRQTGSWVFIIEDKNSLRACLELKPPKQQGTKRGESPTPPEGQKTA